MVGYDELQMTTRTAFIPFADALADLHAFVAMLPIPVE